MENIQRENDSTDLREGEWAVMETHHGDPLKLGDRRVKVAAKLLAFYIQSDGGYAGDKLQLWMQGTLRLPALATGDRPPQVIRPLAFASCPDAGLLNAPLAGSTASAASSRPTECPKFSK